MSVVKVEVEVDVEYLRSDPVEEHLQASTSILQSILGGPAARGHRCGHCGKLYKSAATLHMHCQLKHPPEALDIRCAACDKRYASLMSLQMHMRYMHRFPHRCKACYRTFESEKLLGEHSGVCSRSHRPCPACGKTYDSALSLRNHIKYKHPEEQSNWCEICRRSFTTARGLANHNAAIHPGDIACFECNKKFSSVIAMQSHILYKHSENAQKCKLCRKAFASRRGLMQHMSKHHKMMEYEGGHGCSICGIDFQNYQSVFEHIMEVHSSTAENKSE